MAKKDENSQYSWYKKPCVRCGRPLLRPPLSENIYEQVGVEGVKCVTKDCVLAKNTEEYKRLYWISHFLTVMCSTNFFNLDVQTKVYAEVETFARDLNQMPNYFKEKKNPLNLFNVIQEAIKQQGYIDYLRKQGYIVEKSN